MLNSTCYQLDLFRRNKVAREELHNRKLVQDVMELLEEEKINEFFAGLELLWRAHLSKILAKKCSEKREEVTEKLRYSVFEEKNVEGLYKKALISAKAPKKEDMCACGVWNMVGLEGKIHGERKRLLIFI